MINFRDKKITVMGLGLLGRGIGIVKYLAGKGARLTVTDLKSAKDLASSIREIKNFLKNKKWAHPIKFILGKHRPEDFKNVDMVFKAAGVPLDSPFIAEAKKNGVPIFMDDALFAREAECKIIGITGTRGKTTTSNLIYEITKTTGKKTYFGGNVRGMATLPLLEKVKKNDFVVLELSSWQLQGWRDLGISPRISVVTNIYPDHQNYYKNSMAKYVHDKEAIFTNQTKNDFLVLNKNCAWCRKFAKKAKGKVIWFSAGDVPREWNLKILGEHNLENIAAAMAVGKILDIPAVKIKKIVENLGAVPGRLEFVREIGGVKYYNDTTSTMPEATIAALRAIGGKKNILICGGADKNLNFKNLAPVIKKYAKAVVLLSGTATPKLQKQLLITNYQLPITVVRSMSEAVKTARKFAARGDVVLLSPSAASFGMFKNEFERGDKFLKEVKKIK
ncbi:UDP-N-acetylmuramoyl-L-alanine--D-glutamate ligase [Candidatus Falkowbacteria bacterium]|nr:UDP-N-acetylmuramoyl-L-alanine--D-glutamate ligase [Candidatus Falkowbacteria bacterium]